MRRTFAHDAVVVLAADGDPRAPGAAITVALCGHWDHPPPCPLASHHTDARRSGDEVRLRVLFAAEPADEAEVRRRIVAALESGVLEGGPGGSARWRFGWARPGEVRPDEATHARRLREATS